MRMPPRGAQPPPPPRSARPELRHELPQTRTTDDSARVRPLAWADVLYRLGDLLVSQYDFRPEAGEHFAAA